MGGTKRQEVQGQLSSSEFCKSTYRVIERAAVSACCCRNIVHLDIAGERHRCRCRVQTGGILRGCQTRVSSVGLHCHHSLLSKGELSAVGSHDGRDEEWVEMLWKKVS